MVIKLCVQCNLQSNFPPVLCFYDKQSSYNSYFFCLYSLRDNPKMITFGKITISTGGNVIWNNFQTPTQATEVIQSPKFKVPLCENGEAICRLSMDAKQNRLKIKNVTRKLDKRCLIKNNTNQTINV